MTSRSRFAHEPHQVYLIEGIGGCYVGAALDVAARWRQHFGAACSDARHAELLITELMRHHGPEHYTCRVIANARNAHAAEALEYEHVTRLRAEGKRVLNLFPRLPQHRPAREGRFVGVVVNGVIEPLIPNDPEYAVDYLIARYEERVRNGLIRNAALANERAYLALRKAA